MTAPDLDSLAAPFDKATPGPWRAVHYQHGGMLLQRDNAERAHIQPSLQIVPAEDATLIVAAVNALPSLIAYVRELGAERDALRECVRAADAMRDACAQHTIHNSRGCAICSTVDAYDAASAKVTP